MTEKRFVDYFDKDHNYIIQDLVNEDEYQVGFVNCDEDKFLELVNALAETSCDCITDCEIVMKKLKDENEKLKQELFESKKDYIIETYSNNPIRRDKKLQILKEEFKERFGDLATYITSDELLFDIINETIDKGNSND